VVLDYRKGRAETLDLPSNRSSGCLETLGPSRLAGLARPWSLDTRTSAAKAYRRMSVQHAPSALTGARTTFNSESGPYLGWGGGWCGRRPTAWIAS